MKQWLRNWQRLIKKLKWKNQNNDTVKKWDVKNKYIIYWLTTVYFAGPIDTCLDIKYLNDNTRED